MTTLNSINLEDRLKDLFSYIREGRILDAINDFYAEDAVMQENTQPPTMGRAANKVISCYCHGKNKQKYEKPILSFPRF